MPLQALHCDQVLFVDVLKTYPCSDNTKMKRVTLRQLQQNSSDLVAIFKTDCSPAVAEALRSGRMLLEKFATGQTAKAFSEGPSLSTVTDEFYQFCYINDKGEMLAISTPFEFQECKLKKIQLPSESHGSMVGIVGKSLVLTKEVDQAADQTNPICEESEGVTYSHSKTTVDCAQLQCSSEEELSKLKDFARYSQDTIEKAVYRLTLQNNLDKFGAFAKRVSEAIEQKLAAAHKPFTLPEPAACLEVGKIFEKRISQHLEWIQLLENMSSVALEEGHIDVFRQHVIRLNVLKEQVAIMELELAEGAKGYDDALWVRTAALAVFGKIAQDVMHWTGFVLSRSHVDTFAELEEYIDRRLEDAETRDARKAELAAIRAKYDLEGAEGDNAVSSLSELDGEIPNHFIFVAAAELGLNLAELLEKTINRLLPITGQPTELLCRCPAAAEYGKRLLKAFKVLLSEKGFFDNNYHILAEYRQMHGI